MLRSGMLVSHDEAVMCAAVASGGTGTAKLSTSQHIAGWKGIGMQHFVSFRQVARRGAALPGGCMSARSQRLKAS